MKRLRDAARRAALHASAPALVHLDRRFADLMTEIRERSEMLHADVARAEQANEIADAVRNVERLAETGNAARAEAANHQMARLAALRVDLERVADTVGDGGPPVALTQSQTELPSRAVDRPPTLSARVQAALDSKAASANDFFGGWDEADVQLLQRWACDPRELVPMDGVLVDWLGGRTAREHYPFLPVPDGRLVVADLPVPDDRVHAEAIEYVALLTSIERARAHGSSYTMIELGSSYAPWSVSAALVARRAGFATIDLCAVEASAATIPRIHEHIALNGLADHPDMSFKVVNAAVSHESGTVYFPRVDTRFDNGAQVVSEPTAEDYRGLDVVYDEVDAVTFESLSSDYSTIDFAHFDLQGAEESLLLDPLFIATASERVSAMMLATQSRLIEGLALRALSKNGWRLHRERPTTFMPSPLRPDVNGWTIRDGAQVWLNSRFDLTSDRLT